MLTNSIQLSLEHTKEESMTNPNSELLLNRLIEASDILITALNRALSQSIGSTVLSIGQTQDRITHVEEWKDGWTRTLDELSDRE